MKLHTESLENILNNYKEKLDAISGEIARAENLVQQIQVPFSKKFNPSVDEWFKIECGPNEDTHKKRKFRLYIRKDDSLHPLRQMTIKERLYYYQFIQSFLDDYTIFLQSLSIEE